MKTIFVFVLFTVLYFLSSCNKNAESKKSSPFSSLEIYFEREIDALEQSKVTLTKKLDHQGKVENIFVAEPDWKLELVPFTETLSGQQVRVQSYTTDSIINDAKRTFVMSARDAKATVKSITMFSTDGINDSIVIVKHVSNSYYSSSDTLSYYGRGNYRIKATNIPGIGKEMGFILEGSTSSKVNH